MNPIGVIAAVAAFLGIWFGHVAVRRIEFVSPTIWLPTVIAAVLGLGLLTFSFLASRFSLSAALGILGITFLWDALEFTRQQRRIRKGHAPANPNNPRHTRMMAEPNSHATTLDVLKRDPIGQPFPLDESTPPVKRKGYEDAQSH